MFCGREYFWQRNIQLTFTTLHYFDHPMNQTPTNPDHSHDSKNLEPLAARNYQTDSMAWVDRWTDLLDTKFRIPGTQTRFGADFLAGLLPGVGDALSLSFSGVLIATMAKNGASGKLVVQMLLNTLLDSIVGSIPIFGNIFDLYYKANLRNLRLMREYYEEGKHTGSAWPLIIMIAAVVTCILVAMLWTLLYVVNLFWTAIASTN